MIIQHNSATKIEKVESFFGDDLLGCLCFASEGHGYNLANSVKYSYTIEVDEEKILRMASVWYEHDSDDLEWEAECIVTDVMQALCVDRDRALNLLDGTDTDAENGTDYSGSSAGWYVQQSMGLLANALGYDAAEDHDEQGCVYVVHCVNKKLEEKCH